MEAGTKKLKWLPLLLALLVIVGAAVLWFSGKVEKSLTVRLPYVNEKGEHWGPLPEGPYAFTAASAAKLPVRIVEGNIDPPDVHVGDTQKFRIVVESGAGIARVTAFIGTDTGTTTVELARSERVAAAGGREAWTGEWKVRDTHDTTYRTTFVAYDAAGNKDTLTLAWSDLCGLPVGGNWGMVANNGGSACTVGAGTIDGVDNGNAAVDANTLTVNGTFAWNPGKSITLSGTGKIVIGSGGKLQQSYLYMTDGDSDGYPVNTTQSLSSGRRRYLLTSYNVDCNDGNASDWQDWSVYTDGDGDGYGVGSVQSICGGSSVPSGYAQDAGDCYDSSAVVRPGQSEYFTSQSAYGWDYNCSGSTEKNPSLSGYVADGTPTYQTYWYWGDAQHSVCPWAGPTYLALTISLTSSLACGLSGYTCVSTHSSYGGPYTASGCSGAEYYTCSGSTVTMGCH